MTIELPKGFHVGQRMRGPDAYGFVLEQEFKQTGNMARLRELVQNSIDAIVADNPNGRGKIFLGPAANLHAVPYLEEMPAPKLMIADTGPGMPPEVLGNMLLGFYRTAREQALDKNFGKGAKISTFPCNKLGTIYITFVDGTGYMVRIRAEYVEGTDEVRDYAFESFPVDEHTRSDIVEVDPSVVDALLADYGDGREETADTLKQHGTIVILLGNAPEDATSEPVPGESVNKPRFLAIELNKRYARFPEGIKVKAQATKKAESAVSSHVGRMRNTVTGIMPHLLDTALKVEGDRLYKTADLGDFVAHVFIVNKEGNDTKKYDSSLFPAPGHIATLFQNELYDFKPSGGGTAKALMSLGISQGYDQAVVYFEPKGIKYTPNGARTKLISNQGEVNFFDLYADLNDNLPAEIGAFVAAKVGEKHKNLADDSYKDYLGQHMDFFQPPKKPRKRPQPKGEAIMESDSGSRPLGEIDVPGDNEVLEPRTPPDEPPEIITVDGPSGTTLADGDQLERSSTESKNGHKTGRRTKGRQPDDKGKDKDAVEYPVFKTTSADEQHPFAENTHDEDNDIVGFAAQYVPQGSDAPIIYINLDYQGYEVLKTRCITEAGARLLTGLTDEVMFGIIQNELQKDLGETYMTVLSHKADMNEAEKMAALSESTLTYGLKLTKMIKPVSAGFRGK